MKLSGRNMPRRTPYTDALFSWHLPKMGRLQTAVRFRSGFCSRNELQKPGMDKINIPQDGQRRKSKLKMPSKSCCCSARSTHSLRRPYENVPIKHFTQQFMIGEASSPQSETSPSSLPQPVPNRCQNRPRSYIKSRRKIIVQRH